MADSKKTTAEQLAEANLVKLVESAKAKRAAGKKLTTAEIRAVEKAERMAHRRRDLPYLERMPKKEFIATFGGSSKVYLEWHRERGFPWPPAEDHVDAIAAMRWLREAAAGGHGTTSDGVRLNKARADKAETDAVRAQLELDVAAGRLVAIDEVLVDVGRFGAKVREGIDQLDEEGKNIMLGKLDEAEREIHARAPERE